MQLKHADATLIDLSEVFSTLAKGKRKCKDEIPMARLYLVKNYASDGIVAYKN